MQEKILKDSFEKSVFFFPFLFKFYCIALVYAKVSESVHCVDECVMCVCGFGFLYCGFCDNDKLNFM